MIAFFKYVHLFYFDNHSILTDTPQKQSITKII